jgi:hypothetical protein
MKLLNDNKTSLSLHPENPAKNTQNCFDVAVWVFKIEEARQRRRTHLTNVSSTNQASKNHQKGENLKFSIEIG